MTEKERNEYRAARKRDKSLCRVCGSHLIEIHHIIPRSHGGKTDRRNLICLCKKHHMQAHEDEPLWEEKLLDMMRQHYGIIERKELIKRNKWEELFDERH